MKEAKCSFLRLPVSVVPSEKNVPPVRKVVVSRVHPDEKFIAELRERQLTPTGRAKLRERVGVEHSLSHMARWQGDKARYIGTRKNLFDLRRTAVVHNLHVLARMFANQKSSFSQPNCA